MQKQRTKSTNYCTFRAIFRIPLLFDWFLRSFVLWFLLFREFVFWHCRASECALFVAWLLLFLLLLEVEFCELATALFALFFFLAFHSSICLLPKTDSAKRKERLLHFLSAVFCLSSFVAKSARFAPKRIEVQSALAKVKVKLPSFECLLCWSRLAHRSSPIQLRNKSRDSKIAKQQKPNSHKTSAPQKSKSRKAAKLATVKMGCGNSGFALPFETRKVQQCSTLKANFAQIKKLTN